jgi:radical SAM superfamily enzyme YgiQ (UPF0313 family)
MRYEGTIYRPPSEWQSYILQVTIGCSHNACTFCGMFKDKTYRIRPLHEIFDDIDMAKQQLGSVQQVFLCDGDAISLDTKNLLKILHRLRRTFPELREISTYAGPKSTLAKSRGELAELRAAGLTKVYLGVESGDERVLRETCKGVTAAQMLEAGQNLVNAGLELYAIILSGLAGCERSVEHAKATAQLINRMKPAHLTEMTYTPVPGTKMYRDIEEGKFEVLDARECLIETRTLVENLAPQQLHFLSNHASNYVSIDAQLPADKEAVLQTLDAAIHEDIPLRSERSRGL